MLQNATKYNFKQKSAKQLIKVVRFVSNLKEGSGCGSVVRAVASDIRGPRFESSRRQNLY